MLSVEILESSRSELRFRICDSQCTRFDLGCVLHRSQLCLPEREHALLPCLELHLEPAVHRHILPLRGLRLTSPEVNLCTKAVAELLCRLRVFIGTGFSCYIVRSAQTTKSRLATEQSPAVYQETPDLRYRSFQLASGYWKIIEQADAMLQWRPGYYMAGATTICVRKGSKRIVPLCLLMGMWRSMRCSCSRLLVRWCLYRSLVCRLSVTVRRLLSSNIARVKVSWLLLWAHVTRCTHT